MWASIPLSRGLWTPLVHFPAKFVEFDDRTLLMLAHLSPSLLLVKTGKPGDLQILGARIDKRIPLRRRREVERKR
jgi:hypothetical protein